MIILRPRERGRDVALPLISRYPNSHLLPLQNFARVSWSTSAMRNRKCFVTETGMCLQAIRWRLVETMLKVSSASLPSMALAACAGTYASYSQDRKAENLKGVLLEVAVLVTTTAAQTSWQQPDDPQPHA